jgi:hypothetical protein
MGFRGPLSLESAIDSAIAELCVDKRRCASDARRGLARPPEKHGTPPPGYNRGMLRGVWRTAPRDVHVF